MKGKEIHVHSSVMKLGFEVAVEAAMIMILR